MGAGAQVTSTGVKGVKPGTPPRGLEGITEGAWERAEAMTLGAQDQVP